MSSDFQPRNAERFHAALRRFDDENARDPKSVVVSDAPRPYELAYADWLAAWVLKLRPDASESLRLAARCQHLRRWEIPRESYPMDRAGYLRWRTELKKFHAQKAGEVLNEVGYDEETIRRVQDLNLKKNFPKDPESRVIEDALCLVFLEHQFADLAAKSSEDKMISAVQKTWQKMTPAGRAEALKLHYGERESALLRKALGTG